LTGYSVAKNVILRYSTAHMSIEIHEYTTIITPEKSEQTGRRFRALRVNPSTYQYELILGYETEPGQTESDIYIITFDPPDMLPLMASVLRTTGKLIISGYGTLSVAKGYWNTTDESLGWLKQATPSYKEQRKIECRFSLDGEQLGPVTVLVNDTPFRII
jgi:hypothetical protein